MTAILNNKLTDGREHSAEKCVHEYILGGTVHAGMSCSVGLDSMTPHVTMCMNSPIQADVC